ncbi:acyltransferase [Granulicella sp. L60]|jgi:acetyltransferase-like isoleucine patch superfamily enzyme|uniref:acyltransferase n=1 Tax=Granulicella sp. L60 TaxID=1641866 RepID=UPI00131C614D|nr:acyltransferase [Granulicella sp. L60]
MPILPYRELKPTPEAESIYTRWLAYLNEEFTRHPSPDRRADVVRDELYQLYLGHPRGGRGKPTLNSELGMYSLQESFDCRNVTLEPEYYGDVNAEQYALRKPLIWFWQMFDRSPLGLNHWLGFRFRCMLGKHIFKHLGQGVKIFHNVEFTYGYNLTIEDKCTIHKNVMLDDRGEIILHEGTSVSDYANIYSHTHDINHQADVTNKVTELGPRARVTYHATVLAGASIGEDAMLGALGLATKPVPPATVAVGIPAKVKRSKSAPEQAQEQK